MSVVVEIAIQTILGSEFVTILNVIYVLSFTQIVIVLEDRLENPFKVVVL